MALLGGDSVPSQSSRIVYLGIGEPVQAFNEMLSNGVVDQATSAKAQLEFVELDSFNLVWERSLYDLAGDRQRTELWDKLGSGKIQVGDSVDIEEFYGAIQGSHRYLEQEYGLTEDKTESVRGRLLVMKEVVIETSEGRKAVRIPQLNDTTRKIEGNPLPNQSEVAPKTVERGQNSGDSFRVSFFGFYLTPFERFEASQKALSFLSDIQRFNVEQIRLSAQEFRKNIRESDSAFSEGNLKLSESDLDYLSQIGEDTTGLKVISSDIIPVIMIGFRTAPNMISGTYCAIDFPAEPRKRVVRPE